MRKGRRILRWCIAGFLAIAGSTLSMAGERVVDLTAADGTRLKATYFSADKPGPGVLLLHQCNRQRKVWDGLGRQLAAAGINVLALDYRGFGESAGEPFDQMTPEKANQMIEEGWPGDIDTAFAYLLAQPGVNKSTIGVGGASCGVNNSIQTARRHPEVKSLVLLSGGTNQNGREYLRKSDRLPIFFAAADDDEFHLSVIATEWQYSMAGDAGKKFVHYATGGHGADMFAAHPELVQAIVDWYVTTLIKTPGHAPGTKATPVPEEIRILSVLDEPGGAAKVAGMFEEARRKDPNSQVFSEEAANYIGYERLGSGDTKSAIEILKLNTVAYPNSPNVYDSLSDAYLADGQKDLARQNAKKVLELLPSDNTDNEARKNGIKESAEGKLKQLGDARQ